MTTLCFVDSPAAAAEARQEFPNAVVVTDNPYLSETSTRSDGGHRVENIEALLPQKDANRLGRAALEIAAGVDRELAVGDAARDYGLLADYLSVASPFSRLISPLLHRSAVFARALDEHRPDRIELRIVEAPQREPLNPFLMHRFAAPAESLAGFGFFGNAAVGTKYVPFPLPEVINDTRSDDFLRRVAMLPLMQIAFETLSRCVPIFRARGAIAIGQENDSLRETLPWLWLGGFGFCRVGKLTSFPPGDATPNQTECDAPSLDSVASFLEREIGALGFFDNIQSHAIARLVMGHLTAGLSDMSRKMPLAEKRADDLRDRGCRMLITNSLLGPMGYQLLGLLRDRGIVVVEFEHGVTAGIAELADFKHEHFRPAPADLMLACSQSAVQALRLADASDTLDVQAIGLATQMQRVLRKGWQRRMARRRFGLRASQTTVMHVSTLLQHGNLRPGLNASTETWAFETERRLIEDVYAHIGHKVIFKPYPTQRLPYDPGIEAVVDVADNVEIADAEDFRYVRAAADVIVTHTPTSTLGWCIGVDVPIVWLDSRHVHTLSNEEIRDRFREALLFVDIDRDDWTDELRRLLDRPLGDIIDDWNARADARRALYDDTLVGPRTSAGRLAGRILRDRLTAAPSHRSLKTA